MDTEHLSSSGNSSPLPRSPQKAIQDCRAILQDALLSSAQAVGCDPEDVEIISLRPTWVHRKDREHNMQSTIRQVELMSRATRCFVSPMFSPEKISEQDGNSKSIDTTIQETSSPATSNISSETTEVCQQSDQTHHAKKQFDLLDVFHSSIRGKPNINDVQSDEIVLHDNSPTVVDNMKVQYISSMCNKTIDQIDEEAVKALELQQMEIHPEDSLVNEIVKINVCHSTPTTNKYSKPHVEIINDTLEHTLNSSVIESMLDTVGPPLVSVQEYNEITLPMTKHIDISSDVFLDKHVNVDQKRVTINECDLHYQNAIIASNEPMVQSTVPNQETNNIASSFQCENEFPPPLDDYYGDAEAESSDEPFHLISSVESAGSITPKSESPKCMSLLWKKGRHSSDVDGVSAYSMQVQAKKHFTSSEKDLPNCRRRGSFEQETKELKAFHKQNVGILKSRASTSERSNADSTTNSRKSVDIDSKRSVRFMDPESIIQDHVTICSKCNESESTGSSSSLTSKELSITTISEYAENYEKDRELSRLEHFAKTGNFLFNLYGNDQLTDTSVYVGCHSFTAHACVLSAHSSYMANIILRNANPGVPHVVTLKENVSPCAFKAILDFMYTGEISVNEENAVEILIAAGILEMKVLQEQSLLFMHDIDPSNALLLWERADQQSMEELAEYALKLSVDNFLTVVSSCDYLMLTIQRICKFLSHDDLNITSELQVAKAAINWMSHEIELRQSCIVDLLKCVRLCNMTSTELLELSSLHSCILADATAKRMILTANWYLSCEREQVTCSLPLVQSPTRTLKQNTSNNSSPTTLTPQSSCNSSVCHSPADTSVAPKDFEEFYREVARTFGSASREDRMKHINNVVWPGSLSQICSNATSCDNYDVIIEKVSIDHDEFNPVLSKSDVILKHDTPERHLYVSNSSFCLGNKSVDDVIDARCTAVPVTDAICSSVPVPALYVIGGYDPSAHPVSTLCEYVVQPNQWNWYHHQCVGDSLPQDRSYHTIETLDNILYLIGGCKSYVSDSNIIECTPCSDIFAMNLASSEWNQLASMNTSRMYHASCVLKGRIYVIGGQDEYKRVLSSVEYYSPITDCWQYVSPILDPRSGACAIAIEDSYILVFGGIGSDDKFYKFHSNIDRYNPSTDQWKIDGKLRIPRCFASTVQYGERILLVGGLTAVTLDSQCCSSIADIDEYDLHSKSWKHIASLNTPRHHAAIGALGDNIYIYGGRSSQKNEALDTIEWYNVITNTCENLTCVLPQPLIGSRCVVIT